MKEEGINLTGAFSQEALLHQLGDGCVQSVIDRLHHFSFIPDHIVGKISRDALHEDWGAKNYVLEKYLAIHIPWSIEQGEYTHSHNQFFVTAGHLQTRYGTPLYLAFEENSQNENNPWKLVAAGAEISAPELPSAPKIPKPPQIFLDKEIVMKHDHILKDHPERVDFLNKTPRVAQMCAISGAIQWSLNRGLQTPYWYFGKMNYLVPLYLKTRENITGTPDLIAPIQINEDNLLVRTALPPHFLYPSIRAAFHRHDQLPPWLLSSWKEESEEDSAVSSDELSW